MIFVTTQPLKNLYSQIASRATGCLIFKGSGVWPLQLLIRGGSLYIQLYYPEDLTEWPDTSVRSLAIAITQKRSIITYSSLLSRRFNGMA
jgi:hypothetical protein